MVNVKAIVLCVRFYVVLLCRDDFVSLLVLCMYTLDFEVSQNFEFEVLSCSCRFYRESQMMN